MPLRRKAARPRVVLEPHPDDLPKRGLYTEPIRLTRLEPDVEVVQDELRRVTFLLEVKDRDDKRCSDLAVDVTVEGPERTSTVQGHTDLFGRLRVRMTGPPGQYVLRVVDVAARGLDWDAEAGPRTVTVDAG